MLMALSFFFFFLQLHKICSALKRNNLFSLDLMPNWPNYFYTSINHTVIKTALKQNALFIICLATWHPAIDYKKIFICNNHPLIGVTDVKVCS